MSEDTLIAPQATFPYQAEAEVFIGPKSYYYLEKWPSDPEAKFTNWNWAAFLLPLSWMLYRKLYAEALALTAILSLLYVGAELIFGYVPTAGFGVAGGVGGIYANTWYRNKFLRTMRKSEHLEGEDRLQFLRKKGGTSILSAIVLTPVYILLGIAIDIAIFEIAYAIMS